MVGAEYDKYVHDLQMVSVCFFYGIQELLLIVVQPEQYLFLSIIHC